MAESVINLTKTIMSNPGITYMGGAEIRFHQALYLRPRQIGTCRILYLESGKGEFIFPGETLQIEDRTLLFLSPGLRESHYHATRPVSYLYILKTAIGLRNQT